MRIQRAFFVGLVFLILYAVLAQGPHTSDDWATLSAGARLCDARRLSVDNMRWLDERVDIGHTGRGGALYTKYGVGQIATFGAVYCIARPLTSRAPLVWAGYTVADSALAARIAWRINAVWGALAVAIVARQRGLGPALILGLASPWFYTATHFGSEAGAGLGLLIAGTTSGPVAGLGLSMAMLFRPATAVTGMGFLIAGQWQAVLSSGTGALAVAAYNWWRYGSVFSSGYSPPLFTLNPVGLLGNLIAPGRSVLLFVPWLLWIRPNKRVGTMLGIYFVIHSFWTAWEAGWAWGPRLMYPLLPLAATTLVTLPAWAGMLLGWASVLALASRHDPILTHTAHIPPLSFGQTVWSIQHNIVVLHLTRIPWWAWAVGASVAGGWQLLHPHLVGGRPDGRARVAARE